MRKTTHYPEIHPYQTKDGSLIRELMHPQHHAVAHQSLAEASIPSGVSTKLHRHQCTEEIYHVTEGNGLMTLGADEFPVGQGDTVCIAPGTPHRIRNTGEGTLTILCCCAPAYSHDDTELLE